MEFIFEYQGTSVTLPVNPEEISIEYSSSNKTAEVVGQGEVTIIRKRKLQSMNISTFLPANSNVPYVRGEYEEPQVYIDFFNQVMQDLKPVKIVISDAPSNLFGDSTKRMTVESFVPGLVAQDDDTHISIELKEYRSYSAQEVALISTPAPVDAGAGGGSKRMDDGGKITIGSDVIANGRVHLDSNGSAPGITLSNYQGKVNLIQKGASHPYHVTTPSGGWLGWMTSGSVKKR